jgi:beta-glucosidase
MITADNTSVESFTGKCWGEETKTVAERHYDVIKAGVDQFGGNNDKGPVLEAYRMFSEEFGADSADARFRQSAERLLLNIFRTGLFENPYLDPAESAKIVGCPEFMEEGYSAQLKSVVMLKNHGGALPEKTSSKVFVPKRFFPARASMFGGTSGEAHYGYMIDTALVSRYYEVVETPAEADFALVGIEEPSTGNGYSVEDRERGGNGYVPISLQYRPYTASTAREVSIAGGDPKEDFTNRSYRGKTVKASNESDLSLVISTKKVMGDKPVVVVIHASRPFVPAEFEPYSDAILVSFGVQSQAVLDVASGAFEPSGLLPMQLPENMETVEAQCEDVPRDMKAYVDADGNRYDFAFGLNWKGVIDDDRVRKYR